MFNQTTLNYLDECLVKPKEFCRTCVHKQNHQCGGSIIKYCGARKSNRTYNGLLKIKDKTPACNLYKLKPKQK